ncbi:uncharacterized protein LOC128885072 isoform X1 [Hylaeus volcanicus]|uniref:uncharacterized protein LOC128885072 isoform X1 n=1 Tax=Hylaeus volcanicus TaxID=313075 RepID=UPI0023B79376|nr:uncharacterized protein LOC128885072 isoform X1 [Hylaeus volcanicus]XP_053994802.1 uncharacterized protein LOC128885072 isoform X1 [Hylaeus volcanicus]XP_053994803.1 uncharacterized protein LOC128885072 isoform X1 [Hylaeus volcanicus]
MAGGRSNNKRSGNLDRTCQWLRCHQLYASVVPELPSSETFKRYQKAEKNRIVAKTLSDLQNNILRIFTGSLYCDLNIIHGYNVIRTNQCIIKTRAPHFYKVLKSYFVYTNNHIDCILDNPGIFHHIEGFVRLLYSNSNCSQEEQLLVAIILNVTRQSRFVNASCVDTISNINKRYANCTTTDCNSTTGTKSARNVREYATVDLSPTLSDMADSGLETGSVSPHENTTSENSSTDFEELQVTGYTSPNDDFDKVRVRRVNNKDQKVVDAERYDSANNYSSTCHIKDLVESGLMECTSNEHSATCSSVDAEQPQLDSSSSSTDNAQKAKLHTDEIFQYENHVLSDPFYESDCGSDENESFEFIDLGNASSVSTDVDKESAKGESTEKQQDEKLRHSSYSQRENAQSENVRLEVSFNIPKQKSSSNASNYYFIDASTLNDEVEVLASSVTNNQCFDGKPQSYTCYSSEYVASSSNDLADDQCYKFTSLKTSNLQTGHERVAEFERELKLTEYLEPLTDTRKIRRTDSTSEDKINVNAETNKESLVVEIKEADSGESAHPSPCPDNNKNINNDRPVISRVTNDNDTIVNVINKTETNDKDTNLVEDTRRPSLIRRNTFELDPNDEKISVLRQEYERRQGNLVFKNAIPQYSGHRVDGDSCFIPPDEPPIPVSTVMNQFNIDVQIPSSTQYHAIPYLSLDSGKYEINQTPPENNNSLQSDSKTGIIYPVMKSASEEVIDYHAELEDASTSCSNSLPVTLNCILEKGNRTDTLKKIKCDENTPIISGGVSTSDYSKPTDSPTVRRKTESTPIVSGGSVIMGEPESRTKPARMASSMTAWVVDMSDCNKTETKSTNNSHVGMSQSFSTSECVKKPVRKTSVHDKQGSLGFFVNLKDMDRKPVTQQQLCTAEKKEQNGSSKSYCEFYVDISSTNAAAKNKKPETEETTHKSEKPIEGGDKKNIFSMFIDLSDSSKSTGSTVQPTHRRSFSTFCDKRVETKLNDTNSSENSTTSRPDQSSSDQKSTKEKVKPVFMYIDSDSPVVRRRTLSSSRPAFKRHSWNVDKTQGVNNNGHVAKEIMFRKEHKRAHSLSVDRGDLKKLQAKQSSSNHSLSDATKSECASQRNSKLLQEGNGAVSNMDTSSEDAFEYDVRDTPPNSHVEVINEELRVSVKEHEYTELKAERTTENLNATDVKAYEDEYSETSAWEKTCTESTEGQTRKSETFDISSGSGPSPDSDNHDYELSELLNGEVPNIDRTQVIPAVGNKISETHKSLNETIKKIESELKSPDYTKPEATYDNHNAKHNATAKKNERTMGLNLKATTSNFVRLSDLDKTPVASHTTDMLTIKEDRTAYRMCNSIPETSWIESKLVMSRTNGSVRPLPRKFPSVMSTSLPSKQKSPLEDLTGEYDGEGIISESDLSSMQSSMGRSGAEGSTEETETSSLAGARPYNRLGEDLLRMFLEEINTDVTIDVAGRRIRAHKCILSSRCQYFAAILSGGWIESAGNVISLQGYSYDAVHFALCHIYSGESNIPDSISIVELATLADMLCLEGLKEVIGYTLKVKYCHLFHKPCQICAVGVLECMPLAAAYGLDEVYRKSLRWITRHFVRIWPCKAFATLPRELMEKCYHQHIVHMSTDNVLQTMMDCDKLLATLPNIRWAEPVFRMVSNLLETSVKFLSDNFSGVLGNENFQSLGRELTWNISRLEDNFLAAAERLPPEQACKSYSKLHKMLASAQVDEAQEKIKWGPLFVDFLKKIQCRVEKCLVRDAARAARTTTWLKMDLELRRRIQELACLVILPHETSKRQSRHSNFVKETRPVSSRLTTNRSLDLKRVKMVISEHNDRTLKQMTTVQQTKKVINKPKSDPLERKMQDDKPTTADTSRPKSWPNKIEVKSRYLEPRNKSVPKEIVQPTHPEKIIVQPRRKIMISSSDSSRTSSPAMKRATEKKTLAKIKLPIKKDVKALSSDSLTEPNATRTNIKKDLLSKSCGITRPESPTFKQKNAEIGLSVDSLAESKNKPTIAKKKTSKMDTSMSTDSLMTEITTTPKSNASNKLSPTLGKTTNKVQVYDKAKKSSPPIQTRSPLTIARRTPRSLESSTAASRSRAAAISAYHGSPSLRRSLLDAAKTPDVPSKSLNNVSCKPTNIRPITQSMINHPTVKKDKKEGVPNQQGSESPSKRSSPKSSGTNRISKTAAVVNKRTTSKTPCDEKVKNKCHNGEVAKQPMVGSRSGTFLKDEPTILKKADIKSSQINT